MSNYNNLLKSILGEDGLESLSKAIYRRDTQNVADPLELYLPLLVVPRAILSWLAQNIQKLKVGEHKVFKFPGREDILMNIEKQNTDTYRGEFVQNGRIIHTFDRQTLPSIGGHLMTVGEMYDHLLENQENIKNDKNADSIENTDKLIEEHKRLVNVLESPSHEDDKEEAKKQKEELKELQERKQKEESTENNSKEVVKAILEMSGIQAQANAEQFKWFASHSNIKELTGVIGKLVDALVAREIIRNGVNNAIEEIDKKNSKEEKNDIDKKELKEGKDQHDLKESISPEEKAKADEKAGGKRVGEDNFKDTLKVFNEMDKQSAKPTTEQPVPKSKVVEEGVRAQKAKIEKEEMKPQKKRSFRSLFANHKLSSQEISEFSTHILPHADSDKVEPLSKPYVSEAQRRWAHTEAGTKALGGKEAVKEWDRKSKGKDLPERVSKSDEELSKKSAEAPGGAGMPRKPMQPKQPLPAVKPSNNPAAAAAKQAQASARGQVAAPPKPKGMSNIKKPGSTATNTGAKPKQPKAPNSSDTFKSEKFYNVTEKELYNKCEHCDRPEFIKTESGPVFHPCACFSVMRKDKNGNPYTFVKVLKNEDGCYNLYFNKNVDYDSVRAFLLTLKARMLIKKKYDL